MLQKLGSFVFINNGGNFTQKPSYQLANLVEIKRRIYKISEVSRQ